MKVAPGGWRALAGGAIILAGSYTSSTIRVDLQETSAMGNAAIGLCILSTWHVANTLHEEGMFVPVFSWRSCDELAGSHNQPTRQHHTP